MAPNRQTVYSDAEYVVLGYAIATASGESPVRYITSLIQQLGLTHTSFATTSRLPAPFARGYVGPGSIIGEPPDTDVTVSNPLVPWTAGAVVSTVSDMLTYARELGTGVGLSPRLWKLRRTG